MSGERVERRLAAILAADVAGYSRLMGQDEPGTLARLRAHRRELIDPSIAAHKGRVVKTTSDGILIEFPSVVEAVACAVAVQRGVAERNAATPERVPQGSRATSDVRLYPAPVEALCRIATGFERALLQRRMRFPFGGSLIAIAAKQAIKGGGHA